MWRRMLLSRRNKLIIVILIMLSVALYLFLFARSNVATIELPGPIGSNSSLKRSQSRKFLHITDIHVDEKYVEGSSPESYCHSESLKKGGAGRYGAIGGSCDSPLNLVKETYSFISSEIAPEIDFIIDTGDAVRHNRDRSRPKVSDEGLADHARVARFYEEHLDLDKIQVIPTIGNNDEFAHDTTAAHSPLLKNLTDIWSTYRLNLKDDKDFLKGGYFKVELLDGKLQVLSLNTLAWYKKNPNVEDCNKKGLGKDQMHWLENHLVEARKSGTNVYIVGHIPPNKKSGKQAYSKHCYHDYLDLAGDFSDIILGHFHGHTNADTLSLLVRPDYQKHGKKKKKSYTKYQLITLPKGSPPSFKSSFELVAVLSNAPSIVPVHNPSLRVYDFSPSQGGAILGYTQFYADLNKANRDSKLEFAVEYTPEATYGMEDLSLASWKEFIPRLLDPSTKLYSLYSKFVTVSASKAKEEQDEDEGLDDDDDLGADSSWASGAIHI